MWGSALAMAPVIIHVSKGPDGEVKVSVKILFLEWGVLIPSRAFTFVLSQSLCPCFSQSVSLALSSSNPCSAVFYQILSQGASYKTNRAHQDWAPEDQFGQSLLIYCGPGRVKTLPGMYQAYQIWSADFRCFNYFSLRVIHDENDG